MKEKRGVAPVVATVLLIALTIAAISLIAGFIIPFVKNSLSNTECVKYRDYFKFDESFEYNCYNNNGLHAITMRVNSVNSDLPKLKQLELVFVKAGSGKKVSVKTDDIGSCNVDGINIFKDGCPDVLRTPGDEYSYSVITYVFNAGPGMKYNKAEVYPVTQNGQICEISDSIKLTLCNPLNKLD